MKVDSRAAGDRIIFRNFIVVPKKDTYFSVYEKSLFYDEPTGPEITHGETLHTACKKAKLLQIGYNICRENSY
jgi:hypothetical protein